MDSESFLQLCVVPRYGKLQHKRYDRARNSFFGMWVAALAAVCVDGPAYVSISLATIGFVLFRVIDITKPLGCRWIDRNIHGGWGCMLDDALAGFYAFIVTLIIRYFHLVENIHGTYNL